jgi:Ser/Thr protein kinase RdoA (MazF antagonist)
MIPTRILRAARSGFGLPHGRTRVLSTQFGKVCLAHTDRGGQCTQLRLVREVDDSAARLQTEMAWLTHLSATHGLAVPRPLRWSDDTLVSTRLCDDSDHAWRAIACSWVPGRHIDMGLRARDMRRIGALLATLHLANRDAPTGIAASRPEWWLPRLLKLSAPLRSIVQRRDDTHAGIDPSLAIGLQRAHDQLAAAWDELATGESHVGLIHSDAHPHNLRIARDRIGLVDFEDFANGRFMFDLATIWADLEARPHAAPLLDALLDGYNTTRRLPDDYARDLRVMLAFRRFDLAGWVLSWPRADMKQWGPALLASTPQYIDAHLAQ